MMRALLAMVVLSVACSPASQPTPHAVWKPGVAYASTTALVRGFRDVRGLVHAHSVYSHDACDNAPVRADGSRDPACFDDFRHGVCATQQDFVFLTDHGDSFITTEFPEALLYRPERGDVLVERDGLATANRMACADHDVLLMAGSENGMMPVGLEGHVGATTAEREAVYGEFTTQAATVLHDHGAVILLAHPEDFTLAELLVFPVDGFEMFNLHANTLANAGVALDLLLRVNAGDNSIAVPDLFLLELWNEDARYLQRWGRVLAAGRHLVTTMGTDCHQNAFPTLLQDGERADSYRRTMAAFSNHLRVHARGDGSITDAELKEALAAGRNYGVFEMLGTADGYDAFATKDGTTYEMGSRVPVGATLTALKPGVKNLNPDRAAPEVVMRVLRAVDAEQGFDEVAATSDKRLDVLLTEAGAYRVEVRMLPEHVREDLRDDATRLLDDVRDAGASYVWIYGGTFYVQ